MNAPALALGTIEVEVCFYVDAEKTKLQTYHVASVMHALVAKPLEIPSTVARLSHRDSRERCVRVYEVEMRSR